MVLLFCIQITVRRSRRLLEELRSIKLAAKMRELGISLSFSRPGVSNDNAYAESLFKTMKYHQTYPMRRFRNLDSVRCWIETLLSVTTVSIAIAASSM